MKNSKMEQLYKLDPVEAEIECQDELFLLKDSFKDSYLSFRKDVNKIMDLCNEKRGYNCYDCYSTYCAD